MTTIKFILVALAGYLLGSINFSIWLSRLLGKDIRRTGSGNAGATNMARTFGWGPAWRRWRAIWSRRRWPC